MKEGERDMKGKKGKRRGVLCVSGCVGYVLCGSVGVVLHCVPQECREDVCGKIC